MRIADINIIYMTTNIPTIFFKILPPRNSEISNISEPENFLYNMDITRVKNIAIILIYNTFNIADEPLEIKMF